MASATIPARDETPSADKISKAQISSWMERAKLMMNRQATNPARSRAFVFGPHGSGHQAVEPKNPKTNAAGMAKLMAATANLRVKSNPLSPLSKIGSAESGTLAS